MNKLSQFYKFDGYILLYSLFMSLYIMYLCTSGLDFSMTSLNELYIGEATKHAVNIGARSSIIYKSLFVFLPSFLLSYYLYSRFLRERINRNLIFLSTVGSLQILITALDIDNTKTIHLFFYVFLFISFLLSIPLNQTIKEKLAGKRLAAYNVVLCLLIIYTFQFLFPSHTWINQNTSITFISLFILFCCFPLIFGRQGYGKFQPYFISIAASPILVFLAIEFDVNDVFSFGYKKIFFTLFLTSILLLLLLKKFLKFNFPQTDTGLKYFLIPALLLFFVMSLRYTPFISTLPEFFELANPANALMNIFNYKEIPFLDFMSSHMFSEQGYGILFTLFNGYSADVSFYTYVFFNDIIGILVLYYFLNKAFNKPIYSLAFILTFPFLYYFVYPPIFLGILALFQIIKVVDKQSVKNYFFFFFLLFILILWRLDTGVATLFTSLVFLPLFIFIKRAKVIYRNLIFALLYFLGMLTILVLAAVLLRSGEYVFNNFLSALHYVKGSQAHGYAQIKNIEQHQYYIYHIFFPIIAAVASIVSVFKLRLEKNRYLLFSLFTFLLYFANIQRGLVRHGFAEQKEFYLISVFYLALTLFLIGIINKKNIKEILFYSLGFVLVLFTKFFNFHPQQTDLERSLSNSTFYQLPSLFAQQPTTRVIGQEEFAQKHYAQLKSFFDSNLSEEQSFIDFSNTPMLYFYTERKSPGYFNQNLQNTIDDKTQLHLLQELTTKEYPYVIYGHVPRNWFDKTDGIDNTIRYYLLSEYIHTNYVPRGIVQGYSIWVAKSSVEKKSKLPKDTLVDAPQNYDYGYMAGLIGTYYSLHPADYLTSSDLKSDELDDRSTRIILDEQQSNHSSVYLELNFQNASNEQHFRIEMKDSSQQNIGSFLFKTRTDIGNRYLLRLSNHYLWHSREVSEIIVKSEQNFTLEQVRLLKDSRIEDKTTTSHR
ncbi:hypothetical protein SAMN05216474_2809 [Lishizhenia tianjinensis]|uniref:Uncharacterized protein n=1 Tax=Lishizhenia tianjinensis TaxID=477690 RepID=A0A1I7BG43_9FLAO|nr:hypothetical protein [Lishizhenia tianjinensis]SFT86169.1 hypothetical protein SAMN05216474_2809 [Lishizhenia tianjinensis]